MRRVECLFSLRALSRVGDLRAAAQIQVTNHVIHAIWVWVAHHFLCHLRVYLCAFVCICVYVNKISRRYEEAIQARELALRVCIHNLTLERVRDLVKHERCGPPPCF